MKAIAITPCQPNTERLVEVPMPKVEDVPDGRGVLVKVLLVGVDGTDKELVQGEYGGPPQGYDFLVTGHESFGRVVEVGANVTEFAAGDHVVATVRRPGHSIYDLIGTPDMTTDDTYHERGINLLHGFLTEHYVDSADFLVKIPPGLKGVAVLLEPTSIVEKGIEEAYEIQRRLEVWRPRKAAVMGAGTVGLLAAMAMRARGLDVTAFARTPKPTPNSNLIEQIGARYVSTHETSVADAAAQFGPFDMILEATGHSEPAFEAAHALAKNGILILSSVTGGNTQLQVDADRLNLEFVLGNKVMFGTVNAHRGHFEAGVNDFAKAELTWPGWLSKLLTHPVHGLDNYAELFRTLFQAKDAIKVYMIVSEE
jgi:threonine dehydrogenase-like Zn-dependent dehydrogenase